MKKKRFENKSQISQTIPNRALKNTIENYNPTAQIISLHNSLKI